MTQNRLAADSGPFLPDRLTINDCVELLKKKQKPHFTLAWDNAGSLTLFNYRAIIHGDDAELNASMFYAGVTHCR